VVEDQEVETKVDGMTAALRLGNYVIVLYGLVWLVTPRFKAQLGQVAF
jgi:cell division inhibitor SulA